MGVNSPQNALSIVVVLSLFVAASGVGVASGQPSAVSTFVVDDDGDTAYQTIEAAIAAATAGDRVVVRPGTYDGEVAIEKSITVVAPDGATIEGSGVSGPLASAFEIRGTAAPTIRGFRVVNYPVGVSAVGSAGNWTVADTTIRDVGVGVRAGASTGAWTLRNVTVNSASAAGVLAYATDGAWTVVGARISDVNGVGVLAASSAGDWMIRNSEIVRITEPTRSNASIDIGVVGGVVLEGDGVFAGETSGNWTVTDSVLIDHESHAVNATGATSTGDATGNWWGRASGPTPTQCVGNVNCSTPLSTPPNGSSLPASPPPEFDIPALSTPPNVSVGESFDVFATVTNVGGDSSTQPVELVINGSTVERRSVTLDPGGQETVTFDRVVVSEPGVVTATVATMNESVHRSVVVVSENRSRLAVRYDADGDGSIDFEEVLAVIDGHNRGDVSFDQVLAVIEALNDSGRWSDVSTPTERGG